MFTALAPWLVPGDSVPIARALWQILRIFPALGPWLVPGDSVPISRAL